MPRGQNGHTRIGTFDCRSFPSDTKASKRANLPTRYKKENGNRRLNYFKNN
jgi:hypothetical protein